MAAYRFPVEATHILMFARAIGDENPAYADPDSPEAVAAGGVIAPPTFAMASAQFDPDNVLRPAPGQPWFGSGREPSGADPGSTGWLHAEQHFEYHRPLIAGEVLTATGRDGRTYDKPSRRGGTLTFQESWIDYRSTATGDLVVTARLVHVLPSQPVTRD